MSGSPYLPCPAAVGSNVGASMLPISAYLAAGLTLPSIGFTSPPPSETAGTAFAVSGTVGPSGTAVQVGYSSSNTTAPSSWVAATVSGNTWTANLTVASAGTVYLWCQQTAATSIQAVSAAVTVAGNSVAFTSPPTSAVVSAATSVAGTVSPSATAVRVGWSTSATTAPTSWTSMTVSGTSWSGSVTAPGTAGTYYLWAEQTANTSVQAVSAAVTVSAGAAQASIANQYGSTAFTLNSAYPVYSSYSHTQQGIGVVVVSCAMSPNYASGATAQFYWTSTAPTSEPSSSYAATHTGVGVAPTLFAGSDLAAYLDPPTTAGTWYLSAWVDNNGSNNGGFVLTPITIT